MTIVIGIGGSSRKGGNTDTLLTEALRGAADAGARTSNSHIASLAIGRCLACNACLKTGVCVVDDAAPELLETIWNADGLIVSTPIYFMGPPAPLKALIDRGQSMWARTFKGAGGYARPQGPRKPAGLIMVGGMNFSYMFDPTVTILKAFYASMGFTLKQQLSYRKIDDPGQIKEYPEALKEAYALGKELLKTANASTA